MLVRAYARMQRGRVIVCLNRDAALKKDRAVVELVSYKVNGAAGDFDAVAQRRSRPRVTTRPGRPRHPLPLPLLRHRRPALMAGEQLGEEGE